MAEKENRETQITQDVPLRPYKGLFKDNSPSDQPEGTMPFALNAVLSSEEGHSNLLGREKSNIPFSILPLGYSLIGKVYIGDGETLLFLVKDNISEIGVVDSYGKYTTHVNDKDSEENQKLGFNIANQIQAVYRLRRGCEKVVYFVFKGSKPLMFNLSKKENFRVNNTGNWDVNLFYLQKQYKNIPEISKVSVQDSGGNLPPGSYNVSIQYVDESFNPTEWIFTTETVKIFNDSLSKEYRDINGSITSDESYFDFPSTGKAIRVDLSNLDSNFTYYRLAFIEASSGSGLINNVKITDVIPTGKTHFLFTGDNFDTKGSEEEILAFSDVIEEATSIEQIENMLLLADTSGNQTKFCALQKYASRIKADCILKKVKLNFIEDEANPKNPVHSLEDVGHMPGEIYSYGIVYVFEDRTVSPVFHIPGKSPLISDETIFSPTEGRDMHGMRTNNESESVYISDDSCSQGQYWGRDSEGTPLKGKKVRHHRFPLRSEIDVPLTTSTIESEVSVPHHQILFSVEGKLKTPVHCEPDDSECTPQEAYPFGFRISYKFEGQYYTFNLNIEPEFFAYGETSFDIDLTQNSRPHGTGDFEDIKVYISDTNGDYHLLTVPPGQSAQYNNEHGDYFVGPATLTLGQELSYSQVKNKLVETDILGIKFSGIEVPTEAEVGQKIIGYYIVRNERTELDKTILDTGVLTPCVKNDKYIANGLLAPDGADLESTTFGLIHPEHKFFDKKYLEYDEMIQEGSFRITETKYGKFNYDDVYDGSTYDKDKQKSKNDDGQPPETEPYTLGYDGWSLNVISRDSIVDFEKDTSLRFNKEDFEDRFYLSALESRAVEHGKKDVYNLAADNRIGIIKLKDGVSPLGGKLPYVVLRRKNLDSYPNFRNSPYYMASKKVNYFKDEEESSTILFSGDSYVSPMRYVNTMFWDNRPAARAARTSAWKYIGGALLIIVGALAAIFTGGGSLALVGAGAGLLLAGAGVLTINSGLKQDAWAKAYSKEYDKGLRETVLDSWVSTFYQYKSNVGDYFPTPWGGQTQHSGKHAKDGPSDDTIQWIGDCVTDLWFDTSVNTSLRTKMSTDIPNFLGAPGKVETGQDAPIILREYFKIHYADSNQRRYPISTLENHLAKKLLEFTSERNDAQSYIGVALGEFYHLNPDYLRINKQKVYYHLPLEYDCCSDCQERFPHRWRWSEQSFQEELSDSFRIFLPNNYRDLQGETGRITNLLTLRESLFIHTEEGLWRVPKNHQEVVKDEVVSFIGTGSFFDIPPVKMVDDNSGNSAGLQHKWASLKAEGVYYFVSEAQRTIFEFDGESLRPISDVGLSKWFSKNLGVEVERKYKYSSGKVFPFKDNPSNKFGSGFILAHDSRLKRLLVTKQDFILEPWILSMKDFELTVHNGELKFFKDYEQTIASYEASGYTYIGIRQGRMVFSYPSTELVEVTEYEWIPPVYGPDKVWSVTHIKGNTESRDPGGSTVPAEGSPPQDPCPGAGGGMVSYLPYSPNIPRNLTTIETEYCIYTDDCVQIVHWGTWEEDVNFHPIPNTHPQRFETAVSNCGQNVVNIDVNILEEGYYAPVTRLVEKVVTKFEYVFPQLIKEPIKYDKAWTLSYGMDRSKRENYWISWHSYLPNFYFTKANRLFAWRNNKIFSPTIQQQEEKPGFSEVDKANFIWEQGVGKSYNNFFGEQFEFVIEVVSLSNPLVTKICNHLRLNTTALRLDTNTQEQFEEKLVTFNKAVIYNSTQCSGLLELKVKEETEGDVDFMSNQIVNTNGTTVDRNEDDWFINDFRDIRTDYKSSIWDSSSEALKDKYYIDKVLNVSSLDPDKSWEQLESFRGKYLIVRLIFDKFADINLITNYISQNETLSSGN